MGHEKFTIKLIIAARTASHVNTLSSGFENGQSVNSRDIWQWAVHTELCTHIFMIAKTEPMQLTNVTNAEGIHC